MANSTDTAEGRTYIVGRHWRVKASASSTPRYPHDYELVDDKHLVPNGMWVIEGHPGCTNLVGIDRDQLEEVTFISAEDHKEETTPRRTLYISDRPFGFVSTVADHTRDPYDFRPPTEPSRKILYTARQIHKGELAKSITFERVPYVRQAFEPNKKPSVYKSRERRRSNMGWVRLSDLVAAATNLSPDGLSSEELILGFWRYSGHLNYWYLHKEGQTGGQLLDIVVASSPEEIGGKCPEVLSSTKTEALDLLSRMPEDIWIRRGFAYTVLRLLTLGVRPEVNRLHPLPA